MTQIDKLFNWFQDQLGVIESPKGSNNVIYNTRYYGREVSGSQYMWCLVFIWNAFNANGMSGLFYDGKKTASCTVFMEWAKRTGQWVTDGFQKGDIVFFDYDNNTKDVEHVGFVCGYVGGKLWTIEGNTNDKVANVYRTIDQTVVGAYRPKYLDAATTPVIPTSQPSKLTKAVSKYDDLPTIRFGDIGRKVISLQLLLEGYGYNVGPDGADGEFGPNTRKALSAYQTDKGLSPDGICGPLTHATFWE